MRTSGSARAHIRGNNQSTTPDVLGKVLGGALPPLNSRLRQRDGNAPPPTSAVAALPASPGPPPPPPRPQFDGSREATLLESLVEAMRELDEGKFATVLAAYDAITKLDAWKASVFFWSFRSACRPSTRRRVLSPLVWCRCRGWLAWAWALCVHA